MSPSEAAAYSLLIARRRQNLSDVRLKTYAVDCVFYIWWMYVKISIDFGQKSCLARNQGHDKRGEIWMSLITCGSIHEGHEWFSLFLSRKTRDFYMFGCSIMWTILPIANRGAKISIKSVLLHEIIFFCLSVFSSSGVLGKITSIWSKLPTAACWSREEKTGNCEANLL